ncbi:ABC transporter substrate-binding protein [Halopelagius fulvigenes]|uniref:ABC transporter substrate-binding protein n=1 Tax=Halopelagius fulvigenes TaxID=1198324 RepID=A0ABD5U0J9_9EURY
MRDSFTEERVSNPDQGLNRRSVLKLSGASLAAMSGTAGCLSSGGGGGNTGSQNDNVKFWHKETGSKSLMKNLAQGFGKGNVTVNSFAESKIPSQVQSSLSAGQPPNVLQSKIRSAQLLNGNNALSAKSAQNVMERVGWDNWFSGPKSIVGGQDAYAIPWYAWILMTFYRKSEWEEKGLPEPTTWSEIEECAKALHNPDNNKYGIGTGSKHNYYTTECFQNFAMSNGARVFNSDGEIIFDSDEMVEALEFYAHLHNDYGLPGQNSYPTIKQMYFQENTSLVLWSDWLFSSIWNEASKEMAKDTGIVGHVKKKKKSTYGTVNTFSILKTQDEQQMKAAEDFAYHMQQGEPYLRWLHSVPLGPNPTTKTTANSKEFKSGKYAPDDAKEMFKVFSEELSVIREGFSTLKRFGTVNGKSFSGYGAITSELLISEAVTRVIKGEDAQTVAEEQAEKMRNVISN